MAGRRIRRKAQQDKTAIELLVKCQETSFLYLELNN